MSRRSDRLKPSARHRRMNSDARAFITPSSSARERSVGLLPGGDAVHDVTGGFRHQARAPPAPSQSSARRKHSRRRCACCRRHQFVQHESIRHRHLAGSREFGGLLSNTAGSRSLPRTGGAGRPSGRCGRFGSCNNLRGTPMNRSRLHHTDGLETHRQARRNACVCLWLRRRRPCSAQNR